MFFQQTLIYEELETNVRDLGEYVIIDLQWHTLDSITVTLNETQARELADKLEARLNERTAEKA